jgi:hypothetical protein
MISSVKKNSKIEYFNDVDINDKAYFIIRLTNIYFSSLDYNNHEFSDDKN